MISQAIDTFPSLGLYRSTKLLILFTCWK